VGGDFMEGNACGIRHDGGALYGSAMVLKQAYLRMVHKMG